MYCVARKVLWSQDRVRVTREFGFATWATRTNNPRPCWAPTPLQSRDSPSTARTVQQQTLSQIVVFGRCARVVRVCACVCPVLSCLGLVWFRLVSSRLLSSRLVSSRLVSSRLVSSRLVSSRLVSSCLVLSCLVLSCLVLSCPTTRSPPALRNLTVTTAGTAPFTFHVARTPQSPRHTAHCTPHTHTFLISSILLDTCSHRKVSLRDLLPRAHRSQHSLNSPT